MHLKRHLETVLIGAAVVVVTAARVVPGHDDRGPVTSALASMATGRAAEPAIAAAPTGAVRAEAVVESETASALAAFAGLVRSLSEPQALADAFRSYFGYKLAHAAAVKKPFLYFVDYGLPSTAARGYVFDMVARKIVDGPFTVAHGRGSSTTQYGIPTRFSNAARSEATSLGLYVAGAMYDFTGRTGGHSYSSIGMRLLGVSTGFNDNAFTRRVVVHGAPYVTPEKAGRSEGCPAMEPARAQRLLPMLADGAMVFLFAPDSSWLAGDPWIAAGAKGASVAVDSGTSGG